MRSSYFYKHPNGQQQRTNSAVRQPQGAQNETDKDAQQEASKYSNSEVPDYNKLFIGTIFLFAFLIFNETSQTNENET